MTLSTLKRGLLLLIATSMALSCPIVLANDPSLEKHSELSLVNDNIKKVQRNIIAEREQQAKLSKELQKTETTIGGINRRLYENQQKMIALENQLSSLHDVQKLAKDKLTTQKSTLEQQIRATYILGQKQYIKMLMNQDNPAKVNRMLAYYHYLHENRLHFIQDLTNTLDFLKDNEKEIAQKTASLKQVQAHLYQDRVKFEQSQAKRKGLLIVINTNLANKSKHLAELNDDKFNLEKTLAKLQKENRHFFTKKTTESSTALNPHLEFTKLKSRLQWPTKGRIAKHFGTPVEQSDLTWNGTLIKALAGENVHAIHKGNVIFSGWMRGFGLLLIIDHGDEYMSLYGRNNALYKKVGERVKEGELIAQVGQSGGYDESGLYFEIRHKGRPLNPEKWCDRNIGNRQA